MISKKINQNPETILNKIEKSIKSDNYIFSFLLEHNALESYLNYLFLNIINTKEDISKRQRGPVERLSFDTLLSLNIIIGTIDNELYKKLQEFNKERNNIVHNLIGYDFSEADKDDIITLANNGINLVREISKIYTDYLDSVFVDSMEFKNLYDERP